MKIIGSCLILALACTFSASQERSEINARETNWKLRLDGIGKLRVGMTLDQVNSVLASHFVVPEGDDEKECFYIEPQDHPDTGIMFLKGYLARVDVFADYKNPSNTVTEAGIHVGDSEKRVKAIYGRRVRQSPHHYTDGHYVTILSGKYGLRFETDGRQVTMFYGGTIDAISLVEGCS